MVLQGPRLVDSALGQMSEAPAHRVRNVAGDCGRAVTSYMTGNLLISVICGTRLGGVPVVPVRQPRLCCLQRRSGWGPAAIGGPDLPNSGQRFGDVVISGLAHVDAPHIVTSAEIEEQLAPTMERMRIRPGLLAGLAGVQERRFWDVGEMPSTVAVDAGEQALAASGLDRSVIGALVNTSVSRDYVEPSTASIVHGRLGLPTAAVNMDIGNACLGFLKGMNVVSGLIERGEIQHGLVVDGETSRFAIESTITRLQATRDPAVFREQFATLTLGSGAVAMVLSQRGTVDGGHAFLGGLSRAATEHALLCTGQWDEMKTDTGALLEAGLEVGALTWKEAVDTFGWDPAGFDLYALHQVSLVHTRAMCDRFGLDCGLVDEGSGPPVRLVHGNPSWGFYLRSLLTALPAAGYRVICPDHIGMGRSAKPPAKAYPYTLARRIEDLSRFMAEVDPGEPVTVVLHDWGGAIGMGWAVAHPEQVAGIVLLNTGAFPMPAGMRLPLALTATRVPVLGDVAVLLGNAFARGATYLAVRRRMPRAIRRGYLAPYDSPAHRVAVLRFVRDMPLRPTDSGYAVLARIEERLALFRDRPVLICWGMRDFVFDERILARWEQIYPPAEVHRFPDAAHYVLEDAAAEIVPLVVDFLHRTAAPQPAPTGR